MLHLLNFSSTYLHPCTIHQSVHTHVDSCPSWVSFLIQHAFALKSKGLDVLQADPCHRQSAARPLHSLCYPCLSWTICQHHRLCNLQNSAKLASQAAWFTPHTPLHDSATPHISPKAFQDVSAMNCNCGMHLHLS